ncbi:transcriptional regulator [Candidatus Nanobsidianus stetteri]|uniref:Transcriptional regulator n=1 Tax=Nanobsidianus stetteri TaxID=1294122 RepID=A0A2T9WM26_NANST|nr:transcriptional regulator [Candidatus Nanobsidianus stetteri]MCC5446883.1 transcriptional regulator [Candidatus Nanobsidianus stetteri]
MVDNVSTQQSEKIDIDFKSVPLNPLGKNDIKKLETFLIIGTLYRPEILELIKDPNERSTWIDSLTIAAAAYARYKAGMPISLIADELGRSEETIRNHISGKTKAGSLIIETYEKIKSGQLNLILSFSSSNKELDELKNQLKNLKEEIEKLKMERDELKNIINNKEETIKSLQIEIGRIKSDLDKISREKEEIINKYKLLQNKLLEIKRILENI